MRLRNKKKSRLNCTNQKKKSSVFSGLCIFGCCSSTPSKVNLEKYSVCLQIPPITFDRQISVRLIPLYILSGSDSVGGSKLHIKTLRPPGTCKRLSALGPFPQINLWRSCSSCRFGLQHSLAPPAGGDGLAAAGDHSPDAFPFLGSTLVVVCMTKTSDKCFHWDTKTTQPHIFELLLLLCVYVYVCVTDLG